MTLSIRSFAAVSIAALSVSAFAIDGSWTTGGQTTGTGPWNMTSTDSTFSVLRFVLDPGQGITFGDLTNISYTYDSNLGGIAGGAPRTAVVFTDNTQLLVHWGPAGTFVDPTLGDGLNTGNILMMTDNGRYDLGGVGGSVYTDYTAALALAGTKEVSRISLIVDSFGGHDRDFDIHGFDVQAVPEPATMTVLGAGALALLRRRRAKKA